MKIESKNLNENCRNCGHPVKGGTCPACGTKSIVNVQEIVNPLTECHYHPKRQATTYCRECNALICDDCVEPNDKICKNCNEILRYNAFWNLICIIIGCSIITIILIGCIIVRVILLLI